MPLGTDIGQLEDFVHSLETKSGIEVCILADTTFLLLFLSWKFASRVKYGKDFKKQAVHLRPNFPAVAPGGCAVVGCGW